MLFSGGRSRIKWGEKKEIQKNNTFDAHNREPNAGWFWPPYLSFSALLLLYPSGLTADSCWYSSSIISAWSGRRALWSLVDTSDPYLWIENRIDIEPFWEVSGWVLGNGNALWLVTPAGRARKSNHFETDPLCEFSKGANNSWLKKAVCCAFMTNTAPRR